MISRMQQQFPYCPNTAVIGLPMLPLGSVMCNSEEIVGAISTICTSVLDTPGLIPQPINTNGIWES